MTALLSAFAAQLAILALGSLLLWAVCGRPSRANALLWAAAYPTGAIATTVGMALAGVAGSAFWWGWLVATAIAAMLASRWGWDRGPSTAAPGVDGGLPELPSALRGGLVLLLASKVVFVFAELVHRPLSGWDSFAVWSLRAKVWAARGSLVLDPGDAFYYGGAARPDYPPHASLLQTWTALWVGQWHDVLVNLPWGFYYLSLLAFCFCLLLKRTSRDWAVAATTALAGIPLLVVHAALGGYADLLLATHFTIAVGLVHESIATGERSPRLTAILAALSMPLIKLEGIPLAAACLVTLGLGSASAARGLRRWLPIAALAIAAASLVLTNDALRDFVAGSRLRLQGLAAILDGLFRAGNWQFLWTLFLLVAVGRGRALWGAPLGWMLLNLVGAMAPLLFVLLFTDASDFARARSADSRLFLAVAPSALLFLALALADACRVGEPMTRRPGRGSGFETQQPRHAEAMSGGESAVHG